MEVEDHSDEVEWRRAQDESALESSHGTAQRRDPKMRPKHREVDPQPPFPFYAVAVQHCFILRQTLRCDLQLIESLMDSHWGDLFLSPCRRADNGAGEMRLVTSYPERNPLLLVGTSLASTFFSIQTHSLDDSRELSGFFIQIIQSSFFL